VAPQDRKIKTIRDLKGRKVAVDSFGGTWYLALRDRLREADIDPRDVTFITMPYPQMGGAIAAGQADAATMTSTEYVRYAQRGPVEVVMTGSQLTKLDLDLTQALVAREDWLATHEEVVVRFLAAMLKTRLWMKADIAENGGANIKRMIRERLKFDDFLTDTFYKYRAGYSGRELDFINWMDVPRHAVEQHGATLVGGGLLKGKSAATFDEAVDLRYLKRAFKEVGLVWEEKPD
jgi:ABC-type nitrate/sulfonate/bicarbonate transport system substrate-binding protein